ncbi:PREDICTED: KH domain-containing, RNA-binding, signal transduction-associated protein 2 [Bactrocera latifrons]|uniref:KH domain-containing, RNA-binding, signal transduction-associated protein 2 n=2 Tax=Bactrocera latifrons TaxID=174628 RepID=A0A0K8VT19_BACLA|nr:PREDICTED: KH domain-containing, RNA-binding, signal transduction-associated protein 2 [Bactrocera latifrons]
MPRDYDRDYNDDTTDYKRKRRTDDETGGGSNTGAGSSGDMDGHGRGQDHGQAMQSHDAPPLNEKTNSYLEQCEQEKKTLAKDHTVCKRLIDDEIEKILVSGRIPKPEIYANVYSEKPIRVAQKVLFPIKEYPKFNFVGKILGPKGNTLRQLQEETFCKMVVMGRNSMRDHAKEEELRNSGNPKYAHLSRDLHVEISTVAPPSEAYHRLAYALAEIRKFMIPDANDDIRMEQMREMDGKERMYKKTHYSKSYGEHAVYSCRTPPPPAFEKSSKPKVYSILEKARYVMEDPGYGLVKSHRTRDHELYEHHGEYDRYTPPPPSKHSSTHHAPYESGSYERDYRREYHPHSSSYTAAYPAKPSNGRSSSSYRPATSGSHSSSHYEAGSRSRGESVRYRSAPYPKLR